MTESASIDSTEAIADPDAGKINITRGTISRAGIKFVATSSVRFVVSSAITTLVPVETKKEKRKVFVASMVLSGIINEKVKDYVGEEIDDKLEYYTLAVQKAREMIAAQAEQDASTTNEQ